MSMCAGCRVEVPDAFGADAVRYFPGPGLPAQVYHQACWQTGWYTGIAPKGEWPTTPKEDPWPDEVGHGAGDPVNHPPHYRWLPNGIEVIDITETLGFCMGNAVKYILRADHKGKPEEDIAKAIWYLNRELERRARDNGNSAAVE